MHIDETLTLHINGTEFAAGLTAELTDLDRPLRGVALSDSPVLVEGGRRSDRAWVARRLHALGRRSEQPLHQCNVHNQADALLSLDPHETSRPAGTWVLHNVERWPTQAQLALNGMLNQLTERRFHGRLEPLQMPRVVVLSDGEEPGQALVPQLHDRLRFFHISLGNPEPPTSVSEATS